MVEKFALGKLWTGTNTEWQIKYTTILPSAGKWHNYTVAIRNVKFNQLYKMQLIDLIAVDKQTFVHQCF